MKWKLHGRVNQLRDAPALHAERFWRCNDLDLRVPHFGIFAIGPVGWMREMQSVLRSVEEFWRRSTSICKVRFVSVLCSSCHVLGGSEQKGSFCIWNECMLLGWALAVSAEIERSKRSLSSIALPWKGSLSWAKDVWLLQKYRTRTIPIQSKFRWPTVCFERCSKMF